MTIPYMVEQEKAVRTYWRFAWYELLVYRTYGDAVSIAEKGKTLTKFGSVQTLGTSLQTVATLGSGELHETYATTNAIDTVSSSSSSDTSVTLRVEGHTVSDGVFEFVVQDVALNGQSKVTLSTPLARCSRAYNVSGAALDGAVYVYQNGDITGGVPDTASDVHLVIEDGVDQSEKCATTISDSDYWFITRINVAVNRKASAITDLNVQVRNKDGVFRNQFPIAVSTSGSNALEVLMDDDPIIVPRNADVRVVAAASTGSNIKVSAEIRGPLASIVADGGGDGSLI